MRAALDAVQQIVPANPSVLGIHLEGPFLSPQKPGVHDPAMFRRPTVEDVELLMAARAGVTLVTLAPEQVPAGFIAQLAKAGVRVSLGHSMATYAQTKAALAQGLTGFTHLFNAMRQPESREPGPVVAALEAPGAWFGMIVDGHHVDPAMLRLALRGAARPMLVTDAMPTVGGSRSTFLLYGQEIGVRDGRCTRAGWHARRRSSRHGVGRAQLRRAPRCASDASAALRLHGAGEFSRPWRLPRQDRSRLSRRSRRLRPPQHANPRNMGGWQACCGGAIAELPPPHDRKLRHVLGEALIRRIGSHPSATRCCDRRRGRCARRCRPRRRSGRPWAGPTY